MAILAFLVSCLVKKRQDAPEDDDPKTFMTFMTKNKKQRKMSDLDKFGEDDAQRQIMIRKSLASRASSRTTTTTRNSKGKAPLEAEDLEDDDDDDDEELDNERSSDSLKTDWKAYEADLQRNRSVLIRRHPGVDRSSTGGSSTTPLSPISPTSPTLPMSPTSPMSSMPPMSPTSPASPRPSHAPRRHCFPPIQRKPLSPTATILESPAPPGVGRAPK
ncbi:hypothetical protein AK830_g2681 [Neonectria ditissima]|uniref:Uncharacterized protein n=1 Tax=Neonectria ditissima TaxID=78410 RepID=A0A0P7BUC3_9HYPO|nr:hypothetical protein AK830_g2681 [Neonectria ditissima]